MTSLCCVNCFNDDVIKKIITSHQSFNRCHYCNSNKVASLELSTLIKDLTSILESLSIMFEEDNLAEKLIDILDNDFQIFNKSTDLSRLKNALCIKAPHIFNKKYKSVNTADMHQQWIDFKNEIIHENRFFPQTSIYKDAFLST